MKASVFFIFYFLLASATAAVITYPLFHLIDNDSFRFESWVTRSALLFLIVGIVPCAKYFDLTLSSIGYSASFKSACKQISKGFVIGLFILSIVISVLLLLDIRVNVNPEGFNVIFALKALFAGLLIALIEETLFRGLFFKLAQRWHNAFAAVFISSFFYAILHFIKPVEHIDPTALNFSSGFEVVINAFSGLALIQIDDFLALLSVGILLALVRLKTNSLLYCIGLHASWVFLLKTTKQLTDSNPHSDWSFLTGGYDGIIGLLSFAWLSLLSIAYVIYINNKPTPSPI